MNSLTLLVVAGVLAQAQGFCGSRSLDANLARAAVRAAEWLRNSHDENGAYGLGHTNGFVFHSLRMVGHSVETGDEILRDQINKQGGLESIAGGRLAVYILGVMATCRDPEQFYGLDLVTALLSKVENYPQGSGFNHPFQYSLAIIALCASGKDVGQLKYLNYTIHNIPKQTAKAHASGDTLAMHIFALKCAQKFVNKEWKTKSLKLTIQGAIDKASDILHKRQIQDPTFRRNEVTAALSYLGLLAAEVYQENCSDTMQWLLSRQNPDGSFRNLGATIYVMQSLVGALPYDVRDIACPKNSSDGTKQEMIQVCVTLKFNATHKYSNGRSVPSPVCVEVLNGTNAHEILKLAAKQNSCYSFKAVMTMWGHSVHSICGIHRMPKDKFYWMIYINDKSAKTGIDYLKPSDGSTLLFEFKQLFWRK